MTSYNNTCFDENWKYLSPTLTEMTIISPLIWTKNNFNVENANSYIEEIEFTIRPILKAS